MSQALYATNYTVSTKTDLQNRMNAAMPGDTIIVANGTYDWGQINFTNNNGSSSSAWIVLKAQTFRGVTFKGSTYLQFKGTHVMIDGLCFADGSAGSKAVISFRNASNTVANYCRITNIIIDNYNTYSADSSAENEWVGLYGTNNRIDHCTFINKYNARATIVVWYASVTYPARATSTYHRIDSNYFAGRSYMGDNGGETIRIGDSNSSRTNGYNVVEYNVFEGCTQTEPEIISNKSNFNAYRYNTFKNCHGGLTLRHGRYCSVYGNFFIVDDAAVKQAYGIRVIDKGHKVFNNYFEGVNGNKNSLTSARAPICLYNGLSGTNDTTDASKASGYFPADSTIVAFNTIVNAIGGGGIVLGYTDGGANTYEPLGIRVSNNVVKMSQGQAVYLNPVNTSLTYTAEGNICNAPNGIGVTTTGWQSAGLSFGSRVNGLLQPPSIVQDAAINTANYTSLLNNIDAISATRSSIYDVGCIELNGTGVTKTYPLDSNWVGAGKPMNTTLPVSFVAFDAIASKDKSVMVQWTVSNETNIKEYIVEWSNDGQSFSPIGNVEATNQQVQHTYTFQHKQLSASINYYRIKSAEKDGTIQYSSIKRINFSAAAVVTVYPNPAANTLYINLSGNLQQHTSLLLYDAAGRLLLRKQAMNNNTSIDVSNYITGAYYLQVMMNDKVAYRLPVMIAR